MSQQISSTLQTDFDTYSIIPVNKQAKFLKEIFPNDLRLIFKIIENFKTNPKVVFFHSPDFDEYINIVIYSKNKWLLEVTNTQYNHYKYKQDHICEMNSRKKLLKNLVPAIIAILYTDWDFNEADEDEYKKYFIDTFRNFLKNTMEKKISRIEDYNDEYLNNIPNVIQNNPSSYVRVDIQPHQLPKFKLRKKNIKKDQIENKLIDTQSKANKEESYNSDDNQTREIQSYMTNSDHSWLERSYFLKKTQLKKSNGIHLQENVINQYSEQLTKEFDELLTDLELIDGYGDNNEQKLRNLVDSIIDDKLASRSSNKLIVGHQGTGKSSFAKLLSKLMNARILTIECGPLTDNSDLFGSYEIIIDPETRQAVTIYNENGFMYASKLVKEGYKVVLAVEEYNLLPSETLLKQLNRFFQERKISSFGGRYEINIDHLDDVIVIMTGNHDFNQDWLNDVGLIRRFEFFEFPLPSTESVVECLFNYVINSNFNIRLSYECAERIAEIRDDLVSSINEKTIRPILSKEIKYPDLFTLRNFAMDLIHGVDVETAVKRWIVKIILGGIPNDTELRVEYLNYSKIIQTTVEDRLPECCFEEIQ